MRTSSNRSTNAKGALGDSGERRLYNHELRDDCEALAAAAAAARRYPWPPAAPAPAEQQKQQPPLPAVASPAKEAAVQPLDQVMIDSSGAPDAAAAPEVSPAAPATSGEPSAADVASWRRRRLSSAADAPAPADKLPQHSPGGGGVQLQRSGDAASEEDPGAPSTAPLLREEAGAASAASPLDALLRPSLSAAGGAGAGGARTSGSPQKKMRTEASQQV